MSHLSQKLSELWPFSWFKSWQNLRSKKLSNFKISLTFWDLDQFFFLVKSIYIFKVKQQFRALKLSVGTGITRTQNPRANRVNTGTLKPPFREVTEFKIRNVSTVKCTYNIRTVLTFKICKTMGPNFSFNWWIDEFTLTPLSCMWVRLQEW